MSKRTNFLSQNEQILLLVNNFLQTHPCLLIKISMQGANNFSSNYEIQIGCVDRQTRGINKAFLRAASIVRQLHASRPFSALHLNFTGLDAIIQKGFSSNNSHVKVFLSYTTHCNTHA